MQMESNKLINRAYKLRALFDLESITMEIFKMVIFKLEVPVETFTIIMMGISRFSNECSTRMHLKAMEITKVERLQ